MEWPTPQDYDEAIQNPALCFRDPDLREAQPETWGGGGSMADLPRVISGNFASVYRLEHGARSWGVKCFTSGNPEVQQRYEAISQRLSHTHLPYTVGFELLSPGIKVRGQWYPVLKMEWVEGDLLIEYINKHIDDPAAIRALARRWKKLTAALAQSSIAHGDLQHDNVFVSDEDYKLVDYDGMFVSALEGRRSTELGLDNYQSPRRTAKDFGPYLDHFSEWVIYLSLVALSVEPQLWSRPGAGDECLLLRKGDYEQPERSELLQYLLKHPNRHLRLLAARFVAIIPQPLSEIPPLSDKASRLSIVSSWLQRDVRRKPVTPRSVPASYLWRFAAFLVDVVVIFALMLAALIPFAVVERPRVVSPLIVATDLFALFAWVAIPALYFPLLESFRLRASIGKLILGLKVENASGGPLRFGQAFRRNLLKIVYISIPTAVIVAVVYVLNLKPEPTLYNQVLQWLAIHTSYSKWLSVPVRTGFLVAATAIALVCLAKKKPKPTWYDRIVHSLVIQASYPWWLLVPARAVVLLAATASVALASLQPTSPSHTPPTRRDAAALVRTFYRDINAHKYAAAYALWGSAMRRKETLRALAAQHARTKRDKLTITSTRPAGDHRHQHRYRVDYTLVASKTDGTTERYRGYYIVGLRRRHLKILDGQQLLLPPTPPTPSTAPLIRLVGVTPDSTYIQPGSTVMLSCSVDNESGAPQDVFLGATVYSDQNRQYIVSEPRNDRIVKTYPGVHPYARPFFFSPSAAGQSFDLLVSVDNAPDTIQYDSKWYKHEITVRGGS